MKKLLNKKNNKGFSLVELIVVVLIMGIIAVALAPQVMKWVGTARDNSDSNTQKDIKSAIQIAIADFQGAGGKLTSTNKCDDSTEVPVISGATGVGLFADSVTLADGSTKTLGGYIDEVMGGEYPKTAAGGNFKVKISTAGKVTVVK